MESCNQPQTNGGNYQKQKNWTDQCRKIMYRKIFTIVTLLFFILNNGKGQTENMELLKKSLEENFASDLKEMNQLKERMEKTLKKNFASELKRINLFRDSLKKGFYPDGSTLKSKKSSFKKGEKNINIVFSSEGSIGYQETNSLQDSLENSAKIGLDQNGKIKNYTKQEGNKTTDISIQRDGFYKIEKEKGSLIVHSGVFYPNGKMKQINESEFKSEPIVFSDQHPDPRLAGKSIPNRVINKITQYLYDEDGTLIETAVTEYDDSLFKFTRDDVTAYIKKENLDYNGAIELGVYKVPRKTVNGEIKEEVRWRIDRVNRERPTTWGILLDGKTGEKLYYYNPDTRKYEPYILQNKE